MPLSYIPLLAQLEERLTVIVNYFWLSKGRWFDPGREDFCTYSSVG